MKLLTKVSLVSAIAISGNAMAMQVLDDGALSAASGQEGITLQLKTDGITIDKLLLHDNDGLADNGLAPVGVIPGPVAPAGAGFGGTSEAGAIVINGIELTAVSPDRTLAIVDIDSDAGAGGNSPFLNIGVTTGDINIKVDSIAVGVSGSAIPTATSVSNRRGATNETKILSGYTADQKLDITVGGSALNIQLGNTPQGAMIIANGTVSGGLNISNIAVVDAAGGGAIGLDRIRVTDANSSNLTASAKISISPDGLSIGLGNLAQDIYVDAVRFGSAAGIGTASSTIGASASIGSLEVQGLSLNNTSILVSGH